MAAMIKQMDSVETEVLIRYVVSEAELAEALAVADRLRHHPAASLVLRDYYAVLPDAREEMLADIRIIEENQGTYLFGVSTTTRQYFYIGSEAEALYLGPWEEGLDNPDILLFFGFKDADAFARRLPASVTELDPIRGGKQARAVCIACGVQEGEMHVLGCPVELCPWCGGQLNRCNCRFDQLGVDQIEDEELLERFELLLSEKGRIAFAADQSPSYPTAGDDPGPGGPVKKGKK